MSDTESAKISKIESTFKKFIGKSKIKIDVMSLNYDNLKDGKKEWKDTRGVEIEPLGILVLRVLW